MGIWQVGIECGMTNLLLVRPGVRHVVDGVVGVETLQAATAPLHLGDVTVLDFVVGV